MSRNRTRTLPLLVIGLAATLVLGAAAVTAQPPSPAPNANASSACYKTVHDANNTTDARQRCKAHTIEGHVACDRAAEISDERSVLRARCLKHDAESDKVLRCHALARAGTDWTVLSDRCAERFDRESVKLGVFVTAPSAHGPQPAEGAVVMVYKIERTDRGFAVEPVDKAQTGPYGHAAFELPLGFYVVRAGIPGEGGAHQQVKLDGNERIHLHLSKRDGHQDGPFALGIRAAERGPDGHAQAAAFASVVIQRYDASRDAPRDGQWAYVTTGTTDENGLYTTVLPKGIYRVEIVSHDGEKDGHQRLLLRHDKWVRVGLTPIDDLPITGEPPEPVGPVVIVDPPFDEEPPVTTPPSTVDANATS